MTKQKNKLHSSHRKRQGLHQRHSGHFVKVYWPYLPLIAIVAAGLALSNGWQPRGSKGVLAYATNVSTVGLLESTNEKRTASGKTVLSLNNKLNQAAQAKANDMATRDYWSHNTPEGNEPWIFIDQAGYTYKQAGENLAYGFATSSDTVSGWMNSASHKANMLDGTYQEVGFGFANASNYQSSGPQTIVVAMYGTPQVAAAATPAPASPTPRPAPVALTPTPQPTSLPAAQQPPSPTDQPAPKAEQPSKEAIPVNTAQKPLAEPEPVAVARVQTLTAGKAPWSVFAVGLMTGLSMAYLLFKHGLALRRMIVQGEKFILHHGMFDVTIIALIALCTLLTQNAGIIL